MPRPRKDSTRPEARKRLNTAFWYLLETNELHEITIGAIASHAECNRGTFYYHYQDIEALIENAIEEEFLSDNALPLLIFHLVTGDENEDLTKEMVGLSQKVYRLSLLLEQGGMEQINTTVKSSLLAMWELVLCPNGTQLNQEARLLIEYSINGMLGMLTYEAHHDRAENFPAVLNSFFPNIARYLLKQICELQGVDKVDVLSRVDPIEQAHSPIQ